MGDKTMSWQVLGKVVPGRGNSYYKGSGARMSLLCARNPEKASVARKWWAREKQRLRMGRE